MEYLLGWRMSLAKDLLRHHEIDIAEVASVTPCFVHNAVFCRQNLLESYLADW